MESKACAVVAVVGGPRDGERFVTPLRGLAEGVPLTYFDGSYVLSRNSATGRWTAAIDPVRHWNR